MAQLSIRVLGPLQVRLDEEPVSGFASDKVRALLAYLVSSPDRPHRRETLAGLLWPDFPERSARTNLRNALANLRRVIGDGAALPPFLHCTRQTIQFHSQSSYWLDADAFETLLDTRPPTSEELERAVSLARGTFLEGFTLADAAPFEEWLLLRRERLGRLLIEALDSLVSIYAAEAAYEQALAHARRRVELEPWQEDGQRQLMRLLAQSGQRSQALAQYEALCRSLREELDAEPSPETKALHQAIASGELAPEPFLRPGPPAPIWNLPAATTPFFGRMDELAALEAKLAEPDTRLVTLTGLGGSGKTRLALEMGSRLAQRERQALADQAPLAFPHGIVFVPLAALDSIEGLVPALADALRLRLEGGQDQLLEFLRRKRLLLILDNLEHLLAGAGFLADILRIAPGITILATSRARLQLQGEHALPLGGLPYPEQDLTPAPPGAADPDAYLAAYPALQLVTGGIQRVRPDFAPSAADLPAMLDLCRLVDGLPLALELAASWADALSLDDILAEAQRSLDFWQVDWPDLPERQRSMRAVFDASWRRLTPAEQAAFSSLTVFRGGFALEAAGQVLGETDAIPSLLAALVRKSCLQYDRTKDRYGMHELLCQFGAEKLAQEPARAAEARDRHSATYLDALQRWEANLSGSQQQAALIEAEAESENIRAAWTRAVEQAHIERLDKAMEGLERFYWHSGRYQEAIAALGTAADAAAGRAAKKSAAKATCLRVAVRALAWQSSFCRTLGQWDTARRIQQQCLTLLKDPVLARSDTRLERAILANAVATSVGMADPVRGRQRFAESFSLFRELGHQWGMASALNGWGTLSARLGAHQDATRRLEEALAICRALGNPSGIAGSLSHLAYLARVEGRFEEAEVLAREGYTTALEAGSRHQAGQHQAYLGKALQYLGRFSEAHAAAQQSVAHFRELGNRSFGTQGQAILGTIDLHWGRYAEARDHAETALAMAPEHGPRFTVGLGHFLLGCLDLAEGGYDRAHQHLQDSIAIYRDAGPQDELGWAFAVLALAARALEDARGGREHLAQAFRLAVDLEAVPTLLWALPAMALLLADQGETECAVELYALATRYPFVAKSRWFEDVVGRQIAAVVATLPAERVAILQERGQARDLEATAAQLLSELCE